MNIALLQAEPFYLHGVEGEGRAWRGREGRKSESGGGGRGVPSYRSPPARTDRAGQQEKLKYREKSEHTDNPKLPSRLKVEDASRKQRQNSEKPHQPTKSTQPLKSKSLNQKSNTSDKSRQPSKSNHRSEGTKYHPEQTEYQLKRQNSHSEKSSIPFDGTQFYLDKSSYVDYSNDLLDKPKMHFSKNMQEESNMRTGQRYERNEKTTRRSQRSSRKGRSLSEDATVVLERRSSQRRGHSGARRRQSVTRSRSEETLAGEERRRAGERKTRSAECEPPRPFYLHSGPGSQGDYTRIQSLFSAGSRKNSRSSEGRTHSGDEMRHSHNMRNAGTSRRSDDKKNYIENRDDRRYLGDTKNLNYTKHLDDIRNLEDLRISRDDRNPENGRRSYVTRSSDDIICSDDKRNLDERPSSREMRCSGEPSRKERREVSLGRTQEQPEQTGRTVKGSSKRRAAPAIPLPSVDYEGLTGFLSSAKMVADK